MKPSGPKRPSLSWGSSGACSRASAAAAALRPPCPSFPAAFRSREPAASARLLDPHPLKELKRIIINKSVHGILTGIINVFLSAWVKQHPRENSLKTVDVRRPTETLIYPHVKAQLPLWLINNMIDLRRSSWGAPRNDLIYFSSWQSSLCKIKIIIKNINRSHKTQNKDMIEH